MYRQLNAYGAGDDCALIIYRNSRPKSDASNRRLGETGAGEDVQLDADRKWWPIAPARRPRLKEIVYVVDGTVARIRAVQSQINGARRRSRLRRHRGQRPHD